MDSTDVVELDSLGAVEFIHSNNSPSIEDELNKMFLGEKNWDTKEVVNIKDKSDVVINILGGNMSIIKKLRNKIIEEAFKKNNYVMDILIIVVVIFISFYIKIYNKEILNLINLIEINNSSFAMGLWQVQITISLISISLVSIALSTINNVILGQRMSEVLMIRKSLKITYWDKIFIAFGLGIINFIYVANETISSEIFIFFINMIIVIISIKDTFVIISDDTKFVKVVKEYIIFKNDNAVYDNLSRSIKNKIINNESLTLEKDFILELLGKKNSREYMYLGRVVNKLIKDLINYRKYNELKSFMSDINDEKLCSEEIICQIVNALEEMSVVLLDFKDKAFLNDKIEILVLSYRLCNEKITSKNELESKLNIVGEMFIDANRELLEIKNIYFVIKLFSKINENLDYNMPFFYRSMIKDFSGIYLNSKEIFDNFEKIWRDGDNICEIRSYVAKLLNSLKIESKINYSNKNYFYYLLNIIYYSVESILNNKNLDERDKNSLIWYILDSKLIFRYKESNYNNDEVDFFDEIKHINIGCLIDIFYKNKQYKLISKYTKNSFIIENNDKKLYIYENIINLNLCLCKLDKENIKDTEFREIKEANNSIFSDKEFKSFMLNNIFKSGNYDYNYVDEKIKRIFFVLCLDKHGLNEILYLDKNKIKQLLNLLELDKSEVNRVANLLNINIEPDYKMIESILKNRFKEMLLSEIEGNINLTINKETEKIFTDLIVKELESLKVYDEELKGKDYESTINSNIYLVDYKLKGNIPLMPADVWGNNSNLKPNSNMVVIKRDLILYIVEEIRKRVITLKSENEERIEEILLENKGNITIFNMQKLRKLFPQILKNNLEIDYNNFFNYYNVISDEVLNKLGSIVLDNSFNIRIGYKKIDIIALDENDLAQIVNKNFDEDQGEKDVCINNMTLTFEKEEFIKLIKNTIFKLKLELYIKIEGANSYGYYIE